MAYSTLKEAWGSNFFNESLKNVTPTHDNFLEKLTYKEEGRSYNTKPNTNGPDTRYNLENVNFNIEQQKKDNVIKANIIKDTNDDFAINNKKINTELTEELNSMSISLKKIKNQNINMGKMNVYYKKYMKKSKKIINMLNFKLGSYDKNMKLYLIILIISLIFNFILLIIIIIIISLK
jgi:hypothetical protein